MSLFQYVAKNSDGRTVTGTTEAQNQSMVVKILREQGLIPTQIALAGAGSAAAKKRKGKGGRTSLYDLVLFSRQMATMIRAGLPLIEVLDILAEQAEKVHLQGIARQIEKDVEAGASLTEAIQKHPVFDTFYLSMIRAGEASGMLDTILDQIALYLEKSLSIRRKVKSAVTYPVVVSIIAMAITVFLLIKVVPVFVDIFADIGGKLPIPTQITIGLSNLIRNNFIMGILIIAGVIIFVWQWSKTKTGKYNLDRFKLIVPVFGELFLKVSIAKFSRTFGTLIRAGVNILYALEIVAKTSGNMIIEEAILKTRANIQKGESLTKPLVDSGVFPPMVTRMIDVGEKTGALESMLNKVADFYEDQVDAMVAALTSLIEPLLIVFLGVVVGFIVISMFMPLFKMIEYLQ